MSVCESAHLVCHQCGDGAPDLVVLRTFSKRTEQQEEKPAGTGSLSAEETHGTACRGRLGRGLPGGHRDFGEAGQQHGGAEPDEGDDGPLQEVHFTHQDVGGLGSVRNLLHEVHVHLTHTHTQCSFYFVVPRWFHFLV